MKNIVYTARTITKEGQGRMANDHGLRRLVDGDVPSVELMEAVKLLVSKEQFLREEEKWRTANNMAMVVPLKPWQVWLSDPRGLPALLGSENRVHPEYLSTKWYPEQEPGKQLHFRPSLVISGERSHQAERVWICPVTNGMSQSSAEAAIELKRKQRRVLVHWLRAVSSDTAKVDRELLCYEDSISAAQQSAVIALLQQLILGEWVDDAAPVPGSLVHYGRAGTHFEGIVVANCQIKDGRSGDNVVLIAQAIPDPIFGEYDAELAARYGVLLVRDADSEGSALVPKAFDVLTIRSVRYRNLTVVGHLPLLLEPVRRLLLSFLPSNHG